MAEKEHQRFRRLRRLFWADGGVGLGTAAPIGNLAAMPPLRITRLLTPRSLSPDSLHTMSNQDFDLRTEFLTCFQQ